MISQLGPPASGQQAAGVLFTAEAVKWDSNPATLPKNSCFTSEVTPAYGTRSGGSAVWNGEPKPQCSGYLPFRLAAAASWSAAFPIIITQEKS
ncbi:hypothetical protein [Hymenobacter volaticus]|uniref:Uncharacterized protein n=1 Tax=Hymenobacter volaticus TaxID=2932254 RepID=A0ABY4G1G0_9BACT|nr:hypothetical protein [Hymenobacter volaticus]UOQ64697.1 hypothetical protein MUN86_14080 [Hymenobacter volaticus]